MPSYKIVGIYSFAKNLLDIKLNDPVILKKEVNNTGLMIYLFFFLDFSPQV